MNYYLAVFNCHIKDAERAACEKFPKFQTSIDHDNNCKDMVHGRLNDKSKVDECRWILQLSNGLKLDPINHSDCKLIILFK